MLKCVVSCKILLNNHFKYVSEDIIEAVKENIIQDKV